MSRLSPKTLIVLERRRQGFPIYIHNYHKAQEHARLTAEPEARAKALDWLKAATQDIYRAAQAARVDLLGNPL